MRHVLKIAALAALLGAGVIATPDTASAQGFSVRIGPDRHDRHDFRGPRFRERYIAPRRTVCTTRWVETWRNGRIIRRPTEVCRTR